MARRYLERRGLRCHTENYRCRWGEIDLVMEDDDGTTLVFVEVRYRAGLRFGGAAASIDRRKQRRICHAAADFMARQRGESRACRFDVVALGPDERIDWITAAFEAA